MTPPPFAPTDEQVLDYLLGVLPDDDTQRLDELSVVDDQFAVRLQVAEQDLLDEYAAGRLSGARLEQFTANGGWGQGQPEKVLVARLLRRSQATSAGRAGRHWVAGLAIAASIVLVAGTWAIVERTQGSAGPNTTTTPVQSAAATPPAPAAAATAETPRVFSVVLLPSTRGIADIPAVAIPSGTARVELTLTLESNDFPEYQAVLKDPGTRRTLWTSARLRAEAVGGVPKVSIALPMPLAAQRYVIDLSGFPRRGPSQVLSSYPFRVVQ